MAIVLRIILVVFFLYFMLMIFFFFSQRGLVYQAGKEMNGTPSDTGLPYREVILKTSDNLRLCAWMVGEDADRDVVLFCHGNAGNISHRLETITVFHRLGLRCFLFDYRGYGKSEGKPSEQGTYLDVEAAWQYLTEREKIPPGRIILFGRSLGGAVAAYLAAKPGINARALVLESTFTSLPDLGAQMYPFLPVRLFCRYQYDTRARLPQIRLPVLVIHSPQDEMVPFSHGKTLFERVNGPKQFLPITGSHNHGFMHSVEEYSAGFRGFLEKSKQ